MFGFFLFIVCTNPYLGLAYIYKSLYPFFANRLPHPQLTINVEPTLAYYNTLVILFTFVFTIYLILTLLYLINKLRLEFKDSLNLNKPSISTCLNLNDKLSYWLVLGMLPILLFSVLFYFYYPVSLDFADRSIFIFRSLYKIEPILEYKLYGQFLDYFVLVFAVLANVVMGNLKTFYVINNLKFLQPDYKFKSFTFNGSFKTLKFVVILFGLLTVINLTIGSILKGLLVLPYRKLYAYTLRTIVTLNNLTHYYLLISSLIIVLTFGLIKLVVYYNTHRIYYNENYPILKHLTFFNQNYIDFTIGVLTIANTVAYLVLFLSGLTLCVHYVPVLLITLSYKL